jgi:hypothetical protein
LASRADLALVHMTKLTETREGYWQRHIADKLQ